MDSFQMFSLVSMYLKKRRNRHSSGIDSDTLITIAIIAAVVIVAVIIAVVIAKNIKKKKAAKKVEASSSAVDGNYYTPIAEPIANPVVDVTPSVPVTPAAPVAEPVVEPVAEPVAEPTKTYVKLVNVQTGATYEVLFNEQVTIGKRDCTINIADDNSISGTHCQIYTYEDNFVLADMESTNGTKLNDYKIDSPVFIENGSILGIGKQKFTVTFEKK